MNENQVGLISKKWAIGSQTPTIFPADLNKESMHMIAQVVIIAALAILLLCI